MKEHCFGPVRFISGRNRGRYPFCNSIFIEGAGIVIDPASDSQRLEEIKTSEKVEMVWLSHSHEDHFTYLDIFKDLPLWVSEADSSSLSDLSTMLDNYNVENESERAYWSSTIVEHFNFRPRKPSNTYKKDMVIDLGEVTVEIIPTPGHTPGHVAFFFREPKVVFMGDYDLTSFGPWYGDRHSSIEDTIISLKLLKNLPADIWLTGHDAGIFENPPDSIWDNYEGVIYQREAKLLDALHNPLTLDEILKLWLIYGRPREPIVFFEFGERVLIQKHLEYLQKKGIVSLHDDRYFIS